MHIEFSSALTNLVEQNPSFDSGRLRIAYHGGNRNGSYISKENFERSVPSMYGCPVVANYIREDDEIGSHDSELVKDANGEWQLVNITQPVGFVPPNANWYWEEVEDEGGLHQYLNTEIILWKRQEAYQKIKENGITKHSMEITVNDGHMRDDALYEIDSFYFTAFCLLGTAEPCFESSALFTFDLNDVKSQVAEMLNEYGLMQNAQFQAKEENEAMDILKTLLAKYGLTEEDVTFDIDTLTEEELDARFAEIKKAKDDGDVEIKPPQDPEQTTEGQQDNTQTPAQEELQPENPEPVQEPTPEPTLENEPEQEQEQEPEAGGNEGGESGEDFALASQISDALYSAISGKEAIDTEWGSYPRYFMVDYDISASEVYFEDCMDWNLYGATYEMNGDNAVVDFNSIKRMKYTIVPFDEGTQQAGFFNCGAVLSKKFNDSYSELNTKYNALVKANEDIQKDELIAGFAEVLSGMDEFEALKNNSGEITYEVLEQTLYALVGKKNFTLNKTVAKAGVVRTTSPATNAEEPYGDLFDFKKKN